MHKSTASKLLSVVISLTLGISSLPAVGSAAPAAPAMPDFVKAFTPSQNLGFVESYYQGSSEHPVVLIQDLHANYGVQKKILGLLNFYQPIVAPTGRSMVLGIEGAWGPINLTPIRQETFKTRQTISDLMLKESEISAMEYFAAMSKDEVKLVGIDDPQDYIVHTQLFRKSLAARLSLAKKADTLRDMISESKGQAPARLRNLWRLQENFNAGRIDLAQLSHKLGVQVNSYKEADKALMEAIAAQVNKQRGEKAFTMRNVAEADANLSWVSRLLRQQLSLEEVQIAAKRIPAILVTIRALMPGESTQLWEDTIRAAIDHYAVALLRNKPLGEHALELANQNPDTSVVAVTGGFHTASIAEHLKAHKVSYVVIAPVVESHTTHDEEVYVNRMLDIHVTEAELAASLRASLTRVTVPSGGAYREAVNPTGAFPGFTRQYNRFKSAILNRGALEASSAPEVQASVAVHNLVAESPSADTDKVPGLIDRALNSLRNLAGRPREIEIPATTTEAGKPATNSAEVALVTEKPSVSSKVKAAWNSPTGIAARIVGGTTASIMTIVPLAERAKSAVTPVHADVLSASAVVAVGVGLVMAGRHLLNNTKSGNALKERIQREAQQHFGTAA